MPGITRRKFVGDVAKVSLAATIVPRHVLGGPGYQAPSDTVNVAIVGAGGMGMQNAEGLLSQNIVALADVDFNYVERSLRDRRDSDEPENAEKGRRLTEAFNAARRYADFRVMLDEQRDIDAVVVATPDHTHAVIAKAAMEAGKHVFVQKPLTWSVYEARVMLETARRTGVVTQMGNQGHSTVEAGAINDWLRSGVIGEVRDVHAWTNRPIWPQGMPLPATFEEIEEAAKEAAGEEDEHFMNWRRFNRTLHLSMGRPVEGFDPGRRGRAWPVPEYLDWDLYLGPAPDIPYHPIYHPFNWRGWVNFGVGALGDMGAHLIDHPYWAFELGYPTTVEATSTPWGGPSEDPATYPQATVVRYQYPATAGRPPIHITWYDGGLMPPRVDMLPDDFEFDRTGGVMYVGDRGLLIHETYGQHPRLFPRDLEERFGPAPETDEDLGPQHEMNWIRAIQGLEAATSPFEMAAPLTENMLLGLVALRTGPGKVIRYDPANMFVVNEPEANQYLHREYRAGWTL
ncbi:MAG TPA: Gfo/Idh/MocA family oxidoreductase [Longimicrobiales bacterium]|nr:Gfo/Idh/MocA family oxidoreductase [Longimicrobiales bacterium]